MSSPDPTARNGETVAIARRPALPLGAAVRAIGVPTSPAQLRLARGSCVVGAGTDADLIIDHPTVSRRHVELALAPEGVAVSDLGSRNGTFYLGQRIERAVLALGSRIQLGSVELLLEPDLSTLEPSSDEGTSDYHGLVGTSAAMRRLFAVLARLEGSLVSVLVEGESGVGKELVARALHAGSQIAERPLVVVNCGAVGRELVLSELFGHKKGAFTGASESRAGAFEAADGGTLFLDEVGELPLEVQPVLLRALESGEVKPLGEERVRHVRVRVVAATNRDLRAQVEAGRFREDLYYRLAVVSLRVPPLSERAEDVPLLARHFARQAGAGELTEEVLASLARRRFKGNARELKNAVLAYLALGSLPEVGMASGSLLEAALSQAIDTARPYQEQKEAITSLFSRLYFERLLERASGNQTEAARMAGVERSYFSKLLSKYGAKG